jgi:glyoxylate/hydroxypyruvate reductase A
MVLLLKGGREPIENWVAAFGKVLPDLEVRVWPDCGRREDVEFALVSNMPHGALATFPNLRFVASMSVGVEHLLEDPQLPDVPLVRSVNSQRSATMAQYVLLHVLRYLRRMPDYEAQQQAKVWQRLPYRDAKDMRVGIMGLGSLGLAAAQQLSQCGFNVAGWTRTPHSHDGIANFIGREGFFPFLARSDILVCQLPLTAETQDIIDARALAALPRGAYVINTGRGEHLVEEDLLAALDSGHIAGATLDVFREEPLPADHPFWIHPKVTVTPHNSCDGRAAHGAITIADNIRRAREGRPLVNLVNRAAGY